MIKGCAPLKDEIHVEMGLPEFCLKSENSVLAYLHAKQIWIA